MEIKFRAWDGEEMVYPERMRYDTIKTASAHILKYYDTIMQYTGQKDKNGKEIYVGDRVIDEYGETWEVIFNDGNSCFCLKNEKIGYNSYFDVDDSPADELEVIGHIYEKQN